MAEITRFPLNRKLWVEYQHALVDAAKALNVAQERHRQIFKEENPCIRRAGLEVSITYERTAQPPKEPA